ncbi:t-SNARE [Phycomyces blakesleeanus]|uniref:t-SNARE n=1 Tax=Phycomyces blakesleeanus TaxID=4837 RepID=A0ABR3AY78_PHYBL
MTFKDRTNEFHAIADRIRSRSHVPNALERRSLIQSPSPSGQQASRSEFSLMAAEISRNITSTAGKLEKLTKLAKRKTLFDDKPVEIGELTFIIKQDIAKLNRQIAMLQDYTKRQKQSSKQASEHTSNVVITLQSKLADTSMSFKDVLEIRTENMKMTKDKRDQFLFSAAEQSGPPALGKGQRRQTEAEVVTYAGSTSFLANSPLLKSRRRPNNERTQTPVASIGGSGIGNNNGGYQEQMMVLEQDRYIDHRSTAIESIESTIAELGGIFQQLATMVAEQRETVQRIDQNTDDIEMHVMGAQRELLKYYTNISSNRWLIIKIFVTIVCFFLLFTLIM